MKFIHATRMAVLADYLRRLNRRELDLDPKRFNLRVWSADTETYNEGHVADPLKVPSCGTTACAVGHIPNALPHSKFKLDVYTLFGQSAPSFGRYTGWKAVEKFFDIDYPYAMYLFDRDSYVSATQIMPVVNRLERFIRDEGYDPKVLVEKHRQRSQPRRSQSQSQRSQTKPKKKK